MSRAQHHHLPKVTTKLRFCTLRQLAWAEADLLNCYLFKPVEGNNDTEHPVDFFLARILAETIIGLLNVLYMLELPSHVFLLKVS